MTYLSRVTHAISGECGFHTGNWMTAEKALLVWNEHAAECNICRPMTMEEYKSA